MATIDMFDADKILPSYVDDDWFDLIPKNINIKNSFGVNTVSSGKGDHPSQYIFGAGPLSRVSCPKFVPNSFLNSNIEQNNNLKLL